MDRSPTGRQSVDDEQAPARFRSGNGSDASRDPQGSAAAVAIADDHFETATRPSGPDPDALMRLETRMTDAVRNELRDQELGVVSDVRGQPERIERSSYLFKRAQAGRDAQLQPPGRPVRGGRMILAHLRSPPVACFSPTHRGESEPPFGTSSMVRPAGSWEYRAETQGRERPHDPTDAGSGGHRDRRPGALHEPRIRHQHPASAGDRRRGPRRRARPPWLSEAALRVSNRRSQGTLSSADDGGRGQR